MIKKLTWTRIYQWSSFDKRTKNFVDFYVIKARGVKDDGKSVTFYVCGINGEWQFSTKHEAQSAREYFKSTFKPL